MIDSPVPQSNPAESHSRAEIPEDEAGDREEAVCTEAHRPRRKTLWVVQEKEGSQATFVLVLAGYGDAWAAVSLAGPPFRARPDS